MLLSVDEWLIAVVFFITLLPTAVADVRSCFALSGKQSIMIRFNVGAFKAEGRHYLVPSTTWWMLYYNYQLHALTYHWLWSVPQIICLLNNISQFLLDSTIPALRGSSTCAKRAISPLVACLTFLVDQMWLYVTTSPKESVKSISPECPLCCIVRLGMFDLERTVSAWCVFSIVLLPGGVIDKSVIVYTYLNNRRSVTLYKISLNSATGR